MSNKKNVWSEEQQQKLFTFHQSIGNQWSNIAVKLGTKDQNSIKNKFYSTLRKGIRKINNYLFEIKKKSNPQKYKSIKPIQQIFISKLMAVFDENYDEKYEVKPLAIQLASQIQQKLIAVARGQEQYLTPSKEMYQIQEELVQNIMNFNKSCKKRKGKKKNHQKGGRIQEQDQEIQESEIIHSQLKEEIKKQEEKIKITVNPPQKDIQQQKGPHLSAFLNEMQKKQSTSTIIRVGNNFTNLANQFIKNCGRFQADQDPLFQSANITHSGCLKQNDENWQFESNGSKKQAKQVLYLTEVSPYPNDTSSPYSFGNIMKAKNITGSNMFQDKISCASAEVLENSGLYTMVQPSINVKKQSEFGEILIKSADLKLQINQQSGVNKNENEVSRSCVYRKSSQNKNQINFAKEYAFQLNISSFNNSSLFKSFQIQSQKTEQKTN